MNRIRNQSPAWVLAFLVSIFAVAAAHASEFSIKWLPMPEDEERSTIAKWKAAVLHYTQPIRDKFLGSPETLLIITQFHTYELNEQSKSILPVATATTEAGFSGRF